MVKPRTLLSVALLSVCAAAAAAWLAAQIFVPRTVRSALRRMFPEAAVSIGSFDLFPTHRAGLSALTVERPGSYRLFMRRVQVRYGLLSLLKGSVGNVSLEGVELFVTLPRKRLIELSEYLRLDPRGGGVRIERLSLADARLDVLTQEARLVARVERLRLLPAAQIVQEASLQIDSFSGMGVELKGAKVSASAAGAPGELKIQKLSLGKLALEEVSSALVLENSKVTLSPLTARILGGTVQAKLEFWPLGSQAYYGNFSASNLSLQRITDDFELKERFDMTGIFNGDLSIAGYGMHVSMLNGSFNTLSPGGTLTVTDKETVKTLAHTAGQDAGAVMDSLRDYRYDTGVLSVQLPEKNLILDLHFDGAQGKRTLQIVVHSFKLGGIGK